MPNNEPGQVIQPGGAEQPPAPQPSRPAQEIAPKTEAAAPDPEPSNEQAATWQFTQEESRSAANPPAPSATEVSWSASEFIAHEKDSAWYIKLFGVTILGTAIVFLLTRDKISTAMVAVVAIIFGVYAGRQPRTLPYAVDSKGVSIGAKFYGYELFKSFAVSQDGAFSSIVLLPLKRFMPSMSIYYPPEEEHRIVEVLGGYLPQEQHKLDPLDNLMRRVRF